MANGQVVSANVDAGGGKGGRRARRIGAADTGDAVDAGIERDMRADIPATLVGGDFNFQETRQEATANRRRVAPHRGQPAHDHTVGGRRIAVIVHIEAGDRARSLYCAWSY